MFGLVSAVPVTVPVSPAVPTDFLQIAQTAAEAISSAGPIPTWLAARKVGDRWSILTGASSQGVEVPLISLDWSDTLCQAMVSGDAPPVAADALDVPAYALSPLTETFGIRSYAGTPVRDRRGKLLGTFCGLGSTPLDRASEVGFGRWMGLIDTYSDLLGTQLEDQLLQFAAARDRDLEESLRFADPVTHLSDRLGWSQLLRNEQDRARQLGSSMGIIVLQLRNVRTASVLRRSAQAVLEPVGDSAIVARLGGRQFGILCPDQLESDVIAMARNLEQQCAYAGVTARAGWAMRTDDIDAAEAWKQAERHSMLIGSMSAAHLRWLC